MAAAPHTTAAASPPDVPTAAEPPLPPPLLPLSLVLVSAPPAEAALSAPAGGTSPETGIRRMGLKWVISLPMLLLRLLGWEPL